MDSISMDEALLSRGEVEFEVAEEEAEEEVQPRRSTHTTRPPSKLQNYVTYEVNYPIQNYIFYDRISSKQKSFFRNNR
jgi:hypothetical protein